MGVAGKSRTLLTVKRCAHVDPASLRDCNLCWSPRLRASLSSYQDTETYITMQKDQDTRSWIPALETDCLHLFGVSLTQRLGHSSSGPGEGSWKLLTASSPIRLLLSGPSSPSGKTNSRDARSSPFQGISLGWLFPAGEMLAIHAWSSSTGLGKRSPRGGSSHPKEGPERRPEQVPALRMHRGTRLLSEAAGQCWLQPGWLRTRC